MRCERSSIVEEEEKEDQRVRVCVNGKITIPLGPTHDSFRLSLDSSSAPIVQLSAPRQSPRL